MAQQVGISLVATLGATAVLTGLKGEWRTHAPALFGPGPAATLSASGKFTTRAVTGDDQGDFVSVVDLPPILPMFTAPVVPALDTSPSRAASSAWADPDVGDAQPPARAASRRPPRRVVAAPPPIPRRAAPDGVIAMATLPDLPAVETPPSLWGRSRAAYDQAVTWGGTLLDRLLP